MNPIFDHKKKLRTKILKERANISPDWLDKNSKQIQTRLKSIPEFINAKVIHSYVSWKHEVKTQPLIAETLAVGKTVIVPVVVKSGNQLEHSEIRSLDDLHPGAFGIPEPRHDKLLKIDISKVDCVVIPGVAFDLSGHRLGYGGGYYDAFLKQISALKIGLGFEFQIVEKLLTRDEDEKIDILVTEKKVYDFR